MTIKPRTDDMMKARTKQVAAPLRLKKKCDPCPGWPCLSAPCRLKPIGFDRWNLSEVAQKPCMMEFCAR